MSLLYLFAVACNLFLFRYCPQCLNYISLTLLVILVLGVVLKWVKTMKQLYSLLIVAELVKVLAAQVKKTFYADEFPNKITPRMILLN